MKRYCLCFSLSCALLAVAFTAVAAVLGQGLASGASDVLAGRLLAENDKDESGQYRDHERRDRRHDVKDGDHRRDKRKNKEHKKRKNQHEGDKGLHKGQRKRNHDRPKHDGDRRDNRDQYEGRDGDNRHGRGDGRWNDRRRDRRHDGRDDRHMPPPGQRGI
ncbi:MAG: hypothetical protein LBC94_00685 [Desulfovibrio sp.]|nr:hypothetical protein [Desulfovibrio sp.]